MSRTVRWIAISVAALASALPAGGALAATGDPVLINAALISTTGTDPEWIQLHGTPGASLAGLSVIGVESDAGASAGAIDFRLDFAADAALGSNGSFLITSAFGATTFGAGNASMPDNSLENGSSTLALVETASITGGTADTVGVVLDAVGVTDGGPTDTFAFGAPVVGPDGAFLPAGVRRLVDGVDTDTAGDWKLLVFAPATAPANIPHVTPIHTVQGSGAASPLVNAVVTIDGIVVGDHEGPVPALRGFFVQEQVADVDANSATSEGVFVFNGNADSVSLGDHVRVTGAVVEFGGLTELTQATTTVLSSGNPLPTAATIAFPVTAVADLEAYEAMAATLPQRLVISEYFNYDRFGEVVVALPAEGEARVMSPTAVFAPDTPEAAARNDLNLRSRITIDDGISTQNPSKVVHPITRDDFTLTNAFRGGDTVTGLTGPIFQAFGLYRILPYGDGAGYAEYAKTVAPETPDPVGGRLTVAAMNTLNYFLSLDTADTCGPTQNQDCRGADDADEFARQRPKLLNALEGLDADVIGLVELENTPGVEPLADLTTGLNDRFGAGTYAYVAAGANSVVGTDAIKVGVVYRPGAVTPLGSPAVLDTKAFLDPNNTGADRNRAAVAQSFVENATGEVFSVVVNHLKSKGSACGEPGEGGLVGSCNVTRTLAAQVLADWLATSPTGVADDDWLILGDLNAYDHETPIGVLEAAGYTDLVKRDVGEFAYSFTFDGAVGYLDYALSSPSLTDQVTAATEWHINGDEPDLVDYDTGFKSATQDALFDPTTPFRSSDHDAVVLGLELASGITFRASPDTLWPPNHKLRPISLTASDGTATAFAVAALRGSSTEADSGLGPDDVPNDIVITAGALQLRAERFATTGRAYTVEVVASGGGQVRFGSVRVEVPHSQGRRVV